MSPETRLLITENKLPKGDALAMAEVAGILGVKKTIEILPLCHPLPIESVRVKCEPKQYGIEVTCEVMTTYKTGVEMEALMGVNAALLCIYDLTKPVDPVLSLHNVHLVLKEGGKSGVWRNPEYLDANLSGNETKIANSCAPGKTFKSIKTAVLTISDRCSQSQATDTSGPLLKQMLVDREAEVLWSDLVPDEISQIQRAVSQLKERGAQLIVTTGGTGFSPRDVTPEALAPLFTREVDGFGEMFRAQGAQRTPMSYLSRSISGFIGETLVIALPGSPKACRDGIEILGYLIPHAVHIARGGQHGGNHENSK
jgi:molybdenum cofactor biosynthesis protein MoaC